MRLLPLLLLVGCLSDPREWMARNEYTALSEGKGAPVPVIGPLLCDPGYQPTYFQAKRFPVPEERCGSAVDVFVLVCCDTEGCYGQERWKVCQEPIEEHVERRVSDKEG